MIKFDINPHLFQLAQLEPLALEEISYIGLGISLACLLVTIIFYLSFGYGNALYL